ncbi:thioredoxin-like [Apodemus sylvaticus]|uniref:thioredoxin-like n=1 Tax=Apodemus sylvaticus TaxID=10129 RepID=UPI002241C2EF|nr:thioredoxin-like [Apodemus sylvaticus]
MMKQIKSTEAFPGTLDAAGGNAAVSDFPGTSCGPSERPAPFHSSLNHIPELFLDADADDCWDIAADYEVKCMLVFTSHKRGQKVKSSGAHKEKLEATVNKFAQSCPEKVKQPSAV